MSNFEKLNLSAKILSALQKKGYTQPTAIQEQAIPHLLEGRDLLGIAQTGTGKTAAFALPILDNLCKHKQKVASNGVRALILTPTRELASQIADNIKLYGKDMGLSHIVIFGGVSINNQIKDMKNGFDIVVATPGRLLDLMKRGCVKFGHLEIFVLDEADRMLDMGFIFDVKKIISHLPDKRQTLFFSATMPQDISSLASSILTNPVKIEITPQATTVEKIDQRVNFVDRNNKQALLKQVIEQPDATSVLVFSKTKHGANRIVQFLESNGVTVAAIHGNKSQTAREKALGDFRRGKVKVLIATDIAARGIDIPAISHVINYDIPHDPENYVHRIGRTARAGREGIAISFCDASERGFLKAIEKIIRYEIPVDKDHPFHTNKTSFEPRALTVGNRGGRRGGGSSGGYGAAKVGGEKTSYFGEGRRRKDGFDSSTKPRASREDDRKSRFSSDKKPRFGDDKKEGKLGIFRKFGFSFGKKVGGERGEGASSGGDRRKSFGDRDRKKSFGDSAGRLFGDGDKPRFSADKRGGSAGRGGRRFGGSFGDARSENSAPFADRKKSFSGGDRFSKTTGEARKSSFGDREKAGSKEAKPFFSSLKKKFGAKKPSGKSFTKKR